MVNILDPRNAPPVDRSAVYRRSAWAHYRRMMLWTGELALAMVAVVWVLLYFEFGMVSIHLYIASALGIGLTVMLLGALMGLVFLSHRTGHDDTIIDHFPNDSWD